MLVDGEVDTRQLLDSWLERGVQLCLQPLQKEGAYSTPGDSARHGPLAWLPASPGTLPML